jgi:hypothetical protein
MSLEEGPQFIADFMLGFIAGVLSRCATLRVVTCLIIPFVVPFVALGPENFSSMADGAGLVYIVFVRFVFVGLFVSAVGGGTGYFLRFVLKLKT